MGGLGPWGLWLFLLLAIVVSILLAVGSIWLANRTSSDSAGQEDNSALSPFLTCVGLVFGALLGFTVVVAGEQFSSAETHVANEASTLTTMYRQTVALPAPEQTQMRELLRKYTKAAEGPEWAQQESGGGASDTARAAITAMYRVLGSQPPSDASSAANGEFFGQLTVLTSERNTRVLDAKPRIPWLLWCGLLFGAVVFIALMGFMRLKSRRRHALLASAVAVLLGLLLYIVFCLDHPFGSQLGVTSEPFEHSLQVFDAVDRGT
ncbi:DUF4239 domain-containing protein [Mycobacterium sp.]|uniref:bestrophin-like domain n=1 Tax=Mycobacterium sp. TaxID=1785 RepID=UPI003C76BC7B